MAPATAITNRPVDWLVTWRWLVGFCLALVLVLAAKPAEASLTIDKTVTPTNVDQGTLTTLTYTVTAYNSSSFASVVTLVDQLPAYTTYLPGSTSVQINGGAAITTAPATSGSPQVVTWTRGGPGYNLPIGGTLVLTFQARINSPVPGVFANDITINDINGSANVNDPASTGPTALVSIGDPPAMAVTKTVSPGTIAQGGQATYTVTVNNYGASGTSNLVIKDTLPPGFSYRNNTSVWNGSAIGNPAITGQTLTWAIPATSGLTEVPGNTSRVLTFGVNAPMANGTFQNNVSVTADNAIPVTSGPTATLQVGTGASITVCKGVGNATSTPGCGTSYTAAAGDDFRYMITITNTGTSAVTINNVIDTRPNGVLTYSTTTERSINGGGFAALTTPTIVGNQITWATGFFPYTLAAGQNLRIRFTCVAPDTRSGTFFNNVTVNTTNTNQVTTGPTAPLTVNGPVYNVTKTVRAPLPAVIGAGGGRVDYQIAVSNTGPANGDALITDTFPTGWTLVTTGANQPQRATAPGGPWTNFAAGGTNPVRTWNRAINAGTTLYINFSVNVPAGYAPGQYPDVATVSDTVFNNNDITSTGDTAPVTVVGAPQISITKTVDQAQVLAFQNVVYTIRVRNSGAAGANGTVTSLADTLPVGFNYQPNTAEISTNGITFTPGFQNPLGTFGTITWSGGPGFPITLAPGQERYIRFTVQVSNSPGIYDNNATVSGSNFVNVDTGPTAPVTIGTPPNVSICKGVAYPIDTASACGSTVTRPTGGAATQRQVAYTITVSNSGGIDGGGATITDTLPATFTYMAGSSDVSINGGGFTAIVDPTIGGGNVLTWPNTFTVPAGGNVRIRFNVQAPNTAGSYSNTASVSGTNFTNQTSGPTAAVTVGTAPVVTIATAPTTTVVPTPPATVAAGSTAQYTVRLNNAAGSGNAQGTSISAIMPQFMAVVPGTSQVSVNNGAFADVSDPSPLSGTAIWTGLANFSGGQNLRLRFTVAIDTVASSGTYLTEFTAIGSNFAFTTIGAPSLANLPNLPQLIVSPASAVDLISIHAQATQAGVDLRWSVGAEMLNLGYNLWRADAPTGPRQRINGSLIAGRGTTSHHGVSQYVDATITPGQTYYYWLEDQEFGGLSTVHGPVAITVPTDHRTVNAQYRPESSPIPTPTPTAGGTPNPSATPTPAASGLVTVVSVDDHSITLRLDTPAMRLEDDGNGRKRVVIPGLPLTSEPGMPRLPEAIMPLGAPRDVPYHLDVLDRANPVSVTDIYPIVMDEPAHGGGNGGGNGGTPNRPTQPSPKPKESEPPSPAPSEAPIQPGSVAGTASPAQAGAAQQAAQPAIQTIGTRHLQFAFGVMSASQYPAASAEVAAAADLRAARILQLKLYPVQYDTTQHSLTQYQSMTVRLTFDGATQLAPETPTGPWEKALAILGREYGLLKQWTAVPTAVQDDFVRFAGPTARLTVTHPGLQRITAAALASAHLPTDDPERLRLFYRNQEVPRYIQKTNGNLDALVFYCPSTESEFGDKAYYYLTADTQSGKAMTTVDMPPDPAAANGDRCQDAIHLEENRFYWANTPADAQTEHWFWDTLVPGRPSVTIPFTVAVPAADGGLTDKLRIGLRGAGADPDIATNQHVTVALNGTRIANLRWSGTTYLNTTVGFDHQLLQAGVNHLTLTAEGDTGANLSVSYIDSFDLTYWRTTQAAAGSLDCRFERLDPTTWHLSGFATPPLLVDVTDPTEPTVGTGAGFTTGTLSFTDGRDGFARQYAVAEEGACQVPTAAAFTFTDDLHHAATGADYLVITPSELFPEAIRLARHRQLQGLETQVVKLQAIYDEFSGGHPEPEAIRAFLRWAVSNWPQPKPAYVVLMGDGHFDYRNYYGDSPPIQVPPMLRANSEIGTIAHENAFAAVIGDDALPDLFVGRLPAADLPEAIAIVDKLIAYDEQPDAPWMREALQVADDDDPGFADFANRMALTHADRLNWTGLGVSDPGALLSSLQAGKGLTLYVGHGYTEGWAAEEVFTTWRGGANDIDQLPADGHTGIYVTANCLNGYFHDPLYPSLGEALVKAANKGAVAFWGTAGYTLPVAQYPMTDRFLNYLLRDELDLGTASTLAKISLFLDDSPYWRDEIAAWLLLGDPATRMRRPAAHP
jgi:uncharacterized repeat protein (TIGR01451 family)/fimbrial isopeptide formation D2 family protein